MIDCQLRITSDTDYVADSQTLSLPEAIAALKEFKGAQYAKLTTENASRVFAVRRRQGTGTSHQCLAASGVFDLVDKDVIDAKISPASHFSFRRQWLSTLNGGIFLIVLAVTVIAFGIEFSFVLGDAHTLVTVSPELESWAKSIAEFTKFLGAMTLAFQAFWNVGK